MLRDRVAGGTSDSSDDGAVEAVGEEEGADAMRPVPIASTRSMERDLVQVSPLRPLPSPPSAPAAGGT